MRVLITGAAGLLGSHVVRLCCEKGYQVTAVDINATTSPSLTDLKITKIDADITDAKAMQVACHGQDYICHLAGMIRLKRDTSHRMWTTNVDGVRVIAEAALAARVKRFVHISSVHAFSIYPHNECVDETRVKATSNKHFDYDRSKAFGEIELQKVIAKGLNAVILNPVGILGFQPLRPNFTSWGVMSWFSEKIVMYCDLGKLNSYVDVRDLSQTVINAFTKGRTGENYIIANELIEFKEMVAYAIKLRSNRVPAVAVPLCFLPLMLLSAVPKLKKMNLPAVSSRQVMAYCKSVHFDDGKARVELGHQSRPIFETLTDMYDWYKNNQDEIGCVPEVGNLKDNKMPRI